MQETDERNVLSSSHGESHKKESLVNVSKHYTSFGTNSELHDLKEWEYNVIVGVKYLLLFPVSRKKFPIYFFIVTVLFLSLVDQYVLYS